MYWLDSIIATHGYLGLFLASFLASTIFPLGSEVVVVLLISKGFNLPYVVLVASVGNYLGACTSYYIGMEGRMHVIEKRFKVTESHLRHAKRWVDKYGVWTLLFTWLPVVGDALPIVAGIMKIRFWEFSVFVFTGKLVRYAAVAYLVYAGMVLF